LVGDGGPWAALALENIGPRGPEPILGGKSFLCGSSGRGQGFSVMAMLPISLFMLTMSLLGNMSLPGNKSWA